MTEVTPDNAAQSAVARLDITAHAYGEWSAYEVPDGIFVKYGDHAATVTALKAEVAVAQRRLDACLRFIDGIRDDLHNSRTADWFPEGAHDAAASMSEDMRLIGNACAEFDPYQNTGAGAK